MSNATPPSVDPSSSSAALQKLEPRLRELPADRLVTPRADPKLAALAALAVADRLAQPEVRARFARLPKEELDPKHLDDLRDAAWAAWHAKGQLDAALNAPAETTLAPAAVEAGLRLREGMLRVLRYWCEGDAGIEKQLAPMGRRKTNAELPKDLSKLAALYREKKQLIEADTKNYRATDADEADQIAGQAAQAQGARRAEIEGKGAELVNRAHTLLLNIYEEIRAAGLYLYRRENASELFPSLTSLSAPRGRPRKNAAAGAPPSDPPPPVGKTEQAPAAAPVAN
jgi:hypothetical protein